MTAHSLHTWSQYLTNDDYNYIIEYIENVKHNLANDRMIVLSGEGRTGKSTLINDICNYLGPELCGNCPMSGEFIYYEMKRLGIFCALEEIARSKKQNQVIINCIKYKQSFIAATNHAEQINPNLLQYCRVITMEHVF